MFAQQFHPYLYVQTIFTPGGIQVTYIHMYEVSDMESECIGPIKKSLL